MADILLHYNQRHYNYYSMNSYLPNYLMIQHLFSLLLQLFLLLQPSLPQLLSQELLLFSQVLLLFFHHLLLALLPRPVFNLLFSCLLSHQLSHQYPLQLLTKP